MSKQEVPTPSLSWKQMLGRTFLFYVGAYIVFYGFVELCDMIPS